MTKAKTNPTKRLVCTVSGKGGVGKTTVSRLLVDIYKSNPSISASIYDADGQVGGLARVYNDDGVRFYDLRKDGEREMLLNSVGDDATVIFHDLPGGSRFEISKIIDQGNGDDVSGFLEALKENGIELTLIHVIDSEIESAQSVGQYMKAFGTDGVTHIACLNHREASSQSDFPYWYGSDGKYGKGRAALLEAGGKEIVLPSLRAGTRAKINANKLKFRDAATSSELTLVERSQVKKFIKDFEANISDAKEALGL
ncbi:P-loop NTPase family protein [Gluconobacter kondonii]|uniref:hypothetical protein n=1 Tax=Gluconobacter kondonii TaxID=941463 RepID=UPI001B8BE256|nr:hypothetical protein [Gluconobacter kondonii]MBS1054756.1 hypothetical protein [Gluconobacter kondonii]